MFETASQSGVHLDEVSVSPKKKWTKAKMSRASLHFKINGVIYHDPDAATLMSMKHGDTIILIPATSKCDRWGRVHGGKPIILPYHPEHLKVLD